MILTASKSENQSELQHFADHKGSVPQSPFLMPPDPSIQVPQDKTWGVVGLRRWERPRDMGAEVKGTWNTEVNSAW